MTMTEESAWLDSNSLELDWFTRSLPTVSLYIISYHSRNASSRSAQRTHQEVHSVMDRDILVSFSGALNLNSSH